MNYQARQIFHSVNFNEFCKGEYVNVTTRENTYFTYEHNNKIKKKNVKANTTLSIQTNFTVGNKAWIHIRNYGWSLIFMQDWKITKIHHPRYHAYCLEYAREREKWLQQLPNKMFDLKYVSLTEDGLD